MLKPHVVSLIDNVPVASADTQAPSLYSTLIPRVPRGDAGRVWRTMFGGNCARSLNSLSPASFLSFASCAVHFQPSGNQ